jgi:hypothetical protein
VERELDQVPVFSLPIVHADLHGVGIRVPCALHGTFQKCAEALSFYRVTCRQVSHDVVNSEHDSRRDTDIE